MIHDGRNVERDATLTADLCVIGAGAAGLTLARSFNGSSLRVMVLESGGLDFDSNNQALYRGQNVGLPYLPLEIPRLRVFGGSTMHWGGVLAPLDPIDFESRDWIPHSGWPFPYSELESFYPAAQALCDAGPFRYDIKYWDDPRNRAFPFPPHRLRAKLWQHSQPARFGAKFRAEFEASGNIDVYLHSNVVDLEAAPSQDHLVHLRVRCLNKNRFTVRADRYVLACGGIENARLLLASASAKAPEGVANRNGLVGRFYAGHPRIDAALEGLWFEAPARPNLYERFPTRLSSYPVTANIAIDEDLQRAARLPNTVFRLYLPDSPRDVNDGGGRARAADFGEAGLGVQRLFDDLFQPRIRAPAVFSLRAHPEPVPNPDSCVRLAADKDALGMPRAQLDWRLTGLDKDHLRRAARLVGEEFARADLGRVRMPRWLAVLEEPWPPELFGSWHHMGTTRMGADPKTSVVDPTGRTHQVDNLYIAGSSVFPTFGWATPTLTIVAMALRLADHLKRAMAD